MKTTALNYKKWVRMSYKGSLKLTFVNFSEQARQPFRSWRSHRHFKKESKHCRRSVKKADWSQNKSRKNWPGQVQILESGQQRCRSVLCHGRLVRSQSYVQVFIAVVHQTVHWQHQWVCYETYFKCAKYLTEVWFS